MNINLRNPLKRIFREVSLLVFAIFILIGSLTAQTISNIGIYEFDETRFPIATPYSYSRTKIIYLASELSTGNINTISFKVSNATTDLKDVSRLKVYIAESSISTYSQSEVWDISGYTQVFEGCCRINDGWLNIDLQSSFYYSGTNNLIVAIEYKKNYESNNMINWELEELDNNLRTISSKSDIEFPSDLGLISSLPVTRFIFGGFYANPGIDIETTLSSFKIKCPIPFIGDGGQSIQWLDESLQEVSITSDFVYSSAAYGEEENFILNVSNGDASFISSRKINVKAGSNGIYSFSSNKKVIVDQICYFYDSGGDGKGNKYLNNEDYKVVFSPKAAYYKLKVHFNELSINDRYSDCSSDYLNVYIEGDDTPIYSFCGNTIPSDFELEYGQSLVFEFHSDNDEENDGWDIEISSEQNTDCNAYIGTPILTILGGNCTNRNITLDLANNQGDFIAWEESSDGTTFSELSILNPTNVTGLNTVKYYRALVSDMNSGSCYSSTLSYSPSCTEITSNIICSKDAYISNFSNNSIDQTIINYGAENDLKISKNLNSFFEFDLSTIPKHSIIVSANLVLYGHDHCGINQSSDLLLLRVNQKWSEYDLKWNNQGTVTQKNSIETNLTYNENLNVNIKSIVEEWYNGTSPNYGLCLKLAEEEENTCYNYYAAESSNSTNLYPKLTITYIPIPHIIVNTIGLIKKLSNTENLQYAISGSGIAEASYEVETENSFVIFPPAQGSYSTVNLAFSTSGSSDVANVELTVDYIGNIISAKLNGYSLNSSQYLISGNKISFLDNNSFIEEQNPLPLCPDLKNGYILTPMATSYNSFSVPGSKACKTYSLIIKDKFGETITTVEKSATWDGKVGNNYAPAGTYTYEINADGSIIKGKFLIQY